ncbi:MAG: VWA domain-containing protein, partial [Pseudomonadota bacterium]
TRPPVARPHGGIEMAAVKPDIWADHLDVAPNRRETRATGAGAGDDREADPTRLAASNTQSLAKTDLRHIVDPDEIAAAEQLAYRLASAMRYRLSRRARAANKGSRLDLRRTLRHAIPTGGEPIDLIHRKRPDHPVRIVALLDVSGSMKQYSRFFLQFVKGLVCTWMQADAYLFHTRLVRVTDAVREHDSVKSMMRLSLMMEGFGGGTRIGESLQTFNEFYAKQAINSRTVAMILSDGYDTGAPALLADQLQRLKRRARRIVWLNPLLGWSSYEPVARAMAAAQPHLDHFAAAHTLESLAAIEPDLARL